MNTRILPLIFPSLTKRHSEFFSTETYFPLLTKKSPYNILIFAFQVLYCSNQCQETAYSRYHRMVCHSADHPLARLCDLWK